MFKRNIIQSFKFAIEGIRFMFKSERNIKIHSFVALVAVIASVIFQISHIEFLFVFFSIALVFIAETANTAFELLLDFVHGDKFHPDVKLLKDIAAGGVFVAALNAFMVGIIVFYPKLSVIFK